MCIQTTQETCTREGLAWGPCRTRGTWSSRSGSWGSSRWINQLFENGIRLWSRYGDKKNNDNQSVCAQHPTNCATTTTPRLRSNSTSPSSYQPYSKKAILGRLGDAPARTPPQSSGNLVIQEPIAQTRMSMASTSQATPAWQLSFQLDDKALPTTASVRV